MTSLSDSAITSDYNFLSTDKVATNSEVILLDMNVLLLGSTLTSGNNYNVNYNSKVRSGYELFSSGDYLSYFTTSHDNFVISLNSTNASAEHSFTFFTCLPSSSSIKHFRL